MKIFNPHIPRSFATKSLLLVCLLSTLTISTHYVQTALTEYNSQQVFTLTPNQKVSTSHFNEVIVQAKAVYVYDVTADKVLFEKNADYILPLASITKVMTALVAEENLSGQRIAINQQSFGEYGENKLIDGDWWNFKSLIGYVLTSSSNDGTRAVANAFQAFKSTNLVDAMNTKSKELGFATLSFNNTTGLDIENQNTAGGYGSAKEVAQLFLYTMQKHPNLLEDTKYATRVFNSATQSYDTPNTDIIINDLPNPIASKTGFTALAGGNLVVAFDKGLGEPIIIVVLGSSFDGRFEDVTRLAHATMETYNNTK
jgi:D-alanyl-D-alanine carboxypeptidase